MDDTERSRRGEQFRRLHDGDEILVLPNPWDLGTARLFANLGFQGLATTSAGLAFSLGRRDGDGAVSRDEALEHVRTIVEATALPVTADLENGFGESPETVAQTVRLAGEIGLAGASIEDATYEPDDPIFAREQAIERIQAAVEAARALPYPFTLAELKEFGVRRVTTGTSVCRAGLTAVVRAAREVLDQGTFGYVDGIHSVAEFNDLIDPGGAQLN